MSFQLARRAAAAVRELRILSGADPGSDAEARQVADGMASGFVDVDADIVSFCIEEFRRRVLHGAPAPSAGEFVRLAATLARFRAASASGLPAAGAESSSG